MADTDTSPTQLRLPAEIVRDLFAQAAEGAPFEICGLLAGTAEHAMRVYRVPNISEVPTAAYVMDPAAQVRALYEMEADGLELVAIYHSHPDGLAAEPSLTDLAQATWPTTPYVIVVPPAGGHAGDIRAFMLDPQGSREIPVWRE